MAIPGKCHSVKWDGKPGAQGMDGAAGAEIQRQAGAGPYRDLLTELRMSGCFQEAVETQRRKDSEQVNSYGVVTYGL